MAAPRTTKLDPFDDLEKNGPRPIYAIDGDERMLVDEALRFVRERALPKTARDFNVDTFSGHDAKVVRVLEALSTLPVFADRRFVLVTAADELELEKSEAFLAYIAKPNPTTVLVLVADKFDARTKMYKLLSAHGVVIRCDKPKARELPEFVAKHARAMGVSIAPNAVRVLIDLLGNDLGAILRALEQVDLYVGPKSGRAIGIEDVEAVVANSKEESIFALTDALGRGQRAAAMRGVHGILEVSREAPLRMLAMFARHYRHLIKARAAIDTGASRGDIQRLVGLAPFQVDGVVEQARGRPLSVWASGLASLQSTDAKLKGSRLDGTRVMEQLALGLLRGSDRTRARAPSD